MREMEKRQIAEMTITRGQFLKEILGAETIKYPAERYRVENTPAKNSYLLSAEAAKKSQLQYGGVIVEVVTLADLYIEHAKRLGACLECKAAPGLPCVERSVEVQGGAICEPHDVRLGRPVPVAKQRARDLPACEECRAKAGKPCTNTRGLRMPHKCRMPKRPTAPVAQLDTCATCQAAATHHCTSPTGRKVKPHRGRAVLAATDLRAAGLDPVRAAP